MARFGGYAIGHGPVSLALEMEIMKWRQLVWLLAIALMAACGGSSTMSPVPRDAFTKTWTTRPVLLVGLGDSVTAGFGARRGYSYFDRLARNPNDESADIRDICLSKVLPNLVTRNLAVSGSTSLYLLDKQVPHLEVQLTNVLGLVVITTGGNDLLHDYGRGAPREGAMFGASWEQAQPWIANFEKRLDVILEGITRSFPGGCHIFLANIYDPSDGTGRIRTLAVSLPDWKDGVRILGAYNDVIARVAAKRSNVHLVDSHATFLGHGIQVSGSRCWYFGNVEDPNERGYDALRRVFLREMVKVMR